jgi:ATP-dependent protease ClpP protease subunit
VAKITGIGYSAASIIPMAADRIVIAENGSLGIHPAWMVAIGNRFAMEDNAKWLATLDSQIIDTYAARTGQPRSKIVEWFEGGNHDGTVFSGKEALEFGFADELIPLKQKSSDNSGKKSALSNRMADFEARHRAAIRKDALSKMRQKLVKD